MSDPKPTDAAMKAALPVIQSLRIELHDASKSTIKARAEIARVLDAFAAERVAEEREAIIEEINNKYMNREYLIAAIRKRGNE